MTVIRANKKYGAAATHLLIVAAAVLSLLTIPFLLTCGNSDYASGGNSDNNISEPGTEPGTNPGSDPGTDPGNGTSCTQGTNCADDLVTCNISGLGCSQMARGICIALSGQQVTNCPTAPPDDGGKTDPPDDGGNKPAVPNAPTGVSATAVSSSSITVSWSAVSGATGYYIYRSTTSGGTYTQVGNTSSTSYTNSSGLSANTTYYYKVSAYNNAGEGAQSGYVSATTQSSITVPSAPTGVTATANSSSSITISWSYTGSVTGFYVYRSTSATGSFTQISSQLAKRAAMGPEPISYSYTDRNLSANTTYYYKVAAYNSAGTGAQSGYVSARTLSSVTVPPDDDVVSPTQCKDTQGRLLSCQWPTGCFALDPAYDDKHTSCNTMVAECEDYGRVFYNVTGQTEANGHGANMTCPVLGGTAADGLGAVRFCSYNGGATCLTINGTYHTESECSGAVVTSCPIVDPKDIGYCDWTDYDDIPNNCYKSTELYCSQYSGDFYQQGYQPSYCND